MTNTDTKFKCLILNIIDFLTFGFSLYKNGVCDERIKAQYKLVNDSEMYGYTKREAAKLLGVSVRQFDRYVRAGRLTKGNKVRNRTSLYWDKTYIDNIASAQAF